MSYATPVHQEALTMTDASPRTSLNAIAKPMSHTLTLIKYAVLAVSVAAAVPTARNLYFSWKNGVPFDQVEHRLNQAALLEKNFDCRIDYRTLATSDTAKVEVGSCKKTGDISIKVTGTSGQTNYEWIAFEQLPKPSSQTAGLFDLIVSKALADEMQPRPDTAQPQSIRVAQATVEVLCQGKLNDTIVRVVRENGKCVRETVSIFKGTVERRDEVACDRACPVSN
jgi:hypothetical protein